MVVLYSQSATGSRWRQLQHIEVIRCKETPRQLERTNQRRFLHPGLRLWRNRNLSHLAACDKLLVASRYFGVETDSERGIPDAIDAIYR